MICQNEFGINQYTLFGAVMSERGDADCAMVQRPLYMIIYNVLLWLSCIARVRFPVGAYTIFIL